MKKILLLLILPFCLLADEVPTLDKENNLIKNYLIQDQEEIKKSSLIQFIYKNGKNKNKSFAEFYPAGSKEAIFQKPPSSYFVSENDKMELVVSQNEYRFSSKINVGEFKNYAISSTGSLEGMPGLYDRIIQEYSIVGDFFKDKQALRTKLLNTLIPSYSDFIEKTECKKLENDFTCNLLIKKNLYTIQLKKGETESIQVYFIHKNLIQSATAPTQLKLLKTTTTNLSNEYGISQEETAEYEVKIELENIVEQGAVMAGSPMRSYRGFINLSVTKNKKEILKKQLSIASPHINKIGGEKAVIEKGTKAAFEEVITLILKEKFELRR
ncbi:MAG: hypothetical protein KBF99_06120 [Leptospiraceae bacterium]|nr:hypothetical protein [Leptospiraceae bacterium]MBK9500198.1 hypothetical protein [Leptospiraceae bacterium]MBP9162737.1 hypothetical protein [Leptospiraceae bacterium]